MRDDFQYSYERGSRGARVLVLLTTIAVSMVVGWVCAPMLLAKYAVAVDSPLPRPVEARAAPMIADAPVAKTTVTKPTVIKATVTKATVTDETMVAAMPAPPAVVVEEPAPSAPAPVVVASASPEPIGLPAASMSTLWPADTSAAPSEPVQMASVEPAAAPIEAIVDVPLPRPRPGALIAARSVIPLPRPRPELEDEVPAAELSAFEAQVQRQR